MENILRLLILFRKFIKVWMHLGPYSQNSEDISKLLPTNVGDTWFESLPANQLFCFFDPQGDCREGVFKYGTTN